MQRSTHLTKREGPKSGRSNPRGLRGGSAPIPQPSLMAGGLAESENQAQSSGQVSGITMTLFVAGGIAFMWYMSQEPTQVVAPAPGPA